MRVGIDARHLLHARGVARYVRGMLGALAARFPADEWRAFVPGRAPLAPVAGVEIVRHRLPGRVLFGAAALAGRPTLAALLGSGLDVVWIPAPAPVAPGAPYVLTVHDRSFEARPHDFTAYERLWHRLARPRALARDARAVVADSAAMAAELRAAWGVAAEVVRPGPGAPVLGGRSERAPYLLFVGALEPRKAPDVLARAFAAARARGLRAELVVVGDGRSRGVLERAGAVLAGSVDDAELDALHAGALALVLPSHLEGFGLTPLEAGARGTPSIVSDLPVLREALGDGAEYVPRGDAEALAAAMLRIEADAELRARLGAAAARAASELSWARAAGELRALLERAAT